MSIISIKTINKIKECKYRIFCAEDDDMPNRRVVARNQREIDKILKPYTEDERQILYGLISWTCDNCAEKLIKIGFEVIDYKIENQNKKRTETLSLPTWEDFYKHKYFSFRDAYGNSYELRIDADDNICLEEFPADITLFYKPATKGNYLEVCEIALELFLGE